MRIVSWPAMLQDLNDKADLFYGRDVIADRRV
jgi:hypothetical protein